MHDIKNAEEEFTRGEYQEIEKPLMKFIGNSKYKVIITCSARAQFAQILRYLRQDLGNEQYLSQLTGLRKYSVTAFMPLFYWVAGKTAQAGVKFLRSPFKNVSA